MTQQRIKPAAAVVYPESDGQPMGETDLHRVLMVDLIQAVDRHYRADTDFYVSGNLFIYYEEGNPEKVVAPDFFAVPGISRGLRRVFKLWEEKKGPQVVIEVSSTKTRLEDHGNKRFIYEELQVPEYFIFDPLKGRQQTSFVGFYLKDRVFQPMKPKVSEGGLIVFESAVLALELRAQGPSLRLADPKTGSLLPTSVELEQLLEREKNRAEAEKARAEAAESRAEVAERELARVREELARLRKQSSQ
ncbi:MAG: Uma2 family endonuclease [Planctomycetes bacterium]|nr:Uma2 family endonuclease [Planctomycetota bacterium]